MSLFYLWYTIAFDLARNSYSNDEVSIWLTSVRGEMFKIAREEMARNVLIWSFGVLVVMRYLKLLIKWLIKKTNKMINYRYLIISWIAFSLVTFFIEVKANQSNQTSVNSRSISSMASPTNRTFYGLEFGHTDYGTSPYDKNINLGDYDYSMNRSRYNKVADESDNIVKAVLIGIFSFLAYGIISSVGLSRRNNKE